MNVILLARNYEGYRSGNYYQDLVDAFCRLHRVYLYGPGYINYNREDTIHDVIRKSPFRRIDIDLLVCSPSWDVDWSSDTVDPHPKIRLSNLKDFPKVYFLNKEYKKLDLRFKYAEKQEFDLICTVHPNALKWEKELRLRFLQLHFGISLDKFRDFGLPKRWDFGFTGSLHRNHTDFRFRVKKELFSEQAIDRLSTHGLSSFMRKNPLKHKYHRYKIFWAEYGAKDYLYRSLLPIGAKYAKFLYQFKVFLNTPSAIGIFNTRFFELMAVRTLIICPESESYDNLLENGRNCVMFKADLNDFEETLTEAIENNDKRERIVECAAKDVPYHSYDERVKKLTEVVMEL